MKAKTFKSKYSDMKIKVYENGFIELKDAYGKVILLGRPPNARINLVLDAIKYVEGKK